MKRLIIYLLSLVIIIMIYTVVAYADTSSSVNIDYLNIYGDFYIYSINDGNATITGNGGDRTITELHLSSDINGYPVTKIGEGAFSNLYAVQNVDIPGNIISIGTLAYNYCEKMERVTIHEGVQSIGKFSFWSCSSLESITIPSSVVNIGSGAFSRCSNLKTINVSKDNPVYMSENGVLYDKTTKMLHTYPSGRLSETYVIPQGTVSIGPYAFSYCQNIKSITIPDSTTNIEKYAFIGCSMLSNLSLQNTLDYIGEGAFAYCPKLSTDSLGFDASSEIFHANPVLEPFTLTATPGEYDTLINYLYSPNQNGQQVPAETIQKTQKILEYKELSGFYQELIDYGCKDSAEAVRLFARCLAACKDVGRIGEKISRNSILEYSITHKGLNFYCEDGVPKILLVNTNKKIDSGFSATIKWFKDKGYPDLIVRLQSTGFCIYMVEEDLPGRAIFNGNGWIAHNSGWLRESRYIIQEIGNILMVESFGNAHAFYSKGISNELSGSSRRKWDNAGGMGYLEIVKSILQYYNVAFLYNNSGINEGILERICGDGYATAETWSRIYGIELDSDVLLKWVQIVENLFKPIGADDWDSIRFYGNLINQYSQELSPYENKFFFCARLLYGMDNAFLIASEETGKAESILSRFITREKILKYGTARNMSDFKGLNVFQYPDKSPALCLINVTNRVESGFKEALKQLEKDAPGALKTLVGRGLAAFLQIQNNDGSTISFDYEKGVLLFSCDAEDEEIQGRSGLKSAIYQKLLELSGIIIHPDAKKVTILSDGIDLEANSLTIDLSSERHSVQFSVLISPSDALQSITWKSSDPRIANVSEGGILTGLKDGSVTISASANDGGKAKASVKVIVIHQAKEITISGKNTLESGKQTTLQAAVLPAETTNRKVTWTSSDITVAEVSTRGVVKAKAVTEEKTVIITATAVDGSGTVGEFMITVLP